MSCGSIFVSYFCVSPQISSKTYEHVTYSGGSKVGQASVSLVKDVSLPTTHWPSVYSQYFCTRLQGAVRISSKFVTSIMTARYTAMISQWHWQIQLLSCSEIVPNERGALSHNKCLHLRLTWKIKHRWMEDIRGGCFCSNGFHFWRKITKC